MPEEKVTSKSPKIAVRFATKREFAIIAASERRPEYEIVEDALKLYKALAVKKRKTVVKDVPVQDVISAT